MNASSAILPKQKNKEETVFSHIGVTAYAGTFVFYYEGGEILAKIIYDKNLQIDTPTIILKKRDLTSIGSIICSEITYKNNFNSANELSFKVYKFSDEKLNDLWDAVNDYNIVYIPEYEEYFDIQVSLCEETGTYKTVTGISLAESELSQINLYDIEINTEADIARPDYDDKYPTLFYRDLSGYTEDDDMYKKLKNSSLLHRILDKASHYKIGEVADRFKELKDWYTFSISETNIYDELTGEIAEAYQCLFRFEIKEDGTRIVNVHDLYNYGKDTAIFVSKDNLAASASVESNKDQLKNCFRVSGGDDLITATVANCNPNGTNYFWSFSPEMLENMPESLVKKIHDYNETYDNYINSKLFELDKSHVDAYNKAAKYITDHYPNTTNYPTIGAPNLPSYFVQGYANLSTLLYQLIDLEGYLQSSMMPTPSIDGQSIDDAIEKLTVENLSPIAVSDSSQSAESVVSNAIIGMAKCYVNTALYKISINDDERTYTKAAAKDQEGVWTGSITLTSIEDNTVFRKTPTLNIPVNSNEETYLKQKLDRMMAKSDHSIKDITSMEMSYDDFCKRIEYYSINYLNSTKDAYDDCVSVLNGSDIRELCEKIKSEYQARSRTLDLQISEITKFYNDVDTLHKDMMKIQNTVKNKLNFESFLGKDLWNTFCSYRREDSYKNDNYTSDGLNNSEMTAHANQLIAAAKKELYKASHMQYTVNASLNNLLALKEFQPIADDFECGNWIHMMVNDTLYYLRLMSYEINFDDLTTIPVEFSTVEKIWSGVSDIDSILNSASSIAGSYSSTLSQVANSAKASKYVENWVEKGLDATATKIVNNADNQDIVIDKTGILLRQYDDLTNDYSPYQAKFINNGFYTTSDDWNHVETGLGKICYIDPENNEEKTVYGLIAKTVVGKLFLGEKLQIYGKDNCITLDENGITLDGGAITWKSKISQNNIDGLENTLTDFVKSLGNLQAQIDGQIETWYYDHEPALNNIPASEWNTESERAKHEGDLFYWKSKGYSYRFLKDTNTWKWQMVQDTDITKALAEAAQAQDTADSKRRVFVATPYPPYDVGDLWTQGENGNLYLCIHDKQTGSFSSSDWQLATKYTDNSYAETVNEHIETFKNNVNSLLNADLSLTEMGDDYIFSPYIGGGYLYIKNPNDERSVTINPLQNKLLSDNDNIFKVTDKFGTTTIGADSDGNAFFTGSVYASSGNMGGWTIKKDELSYGKNSSDGNYMLIKPSTNTILSMNNSNRAILTAGVLKFERKENGQDIPYSSLKINQWTDTGILGTCLNSEASSKFISFGNKKSESDNGYSTYFLLNYGLNPDGNKEGVLFYSPAKFFSNLTIDGIVDMNSQVNLNNNLLIFGYDKHDEAVYLDYDKDLKGVVCSHTLYSNYDKVSVEGHNLNTHIFNWNENKTAGTGSDYRLASPAYVEDNYVAKESDERVKTNFTTLPPNIDNIFDSLCAMQYSYKDGLNKKGFFWGDTAQHIEKILCDNGLNPENYAIVGKRIVNRELGEDKYIKDDDFHYIDQNNILWLCVDQIQKLKKQLYEMKKKYDLE